MLGRSLKQASNQSLSFHSLRWFAAASAQPQAYTEWAKRFDQLAKTYPKLFSSDFVKDQENYLKKNYTKANLDKYLKGYNEACAQMDEKTGENVLIRHSSDDLLASPTKPVQSYVQSKEEAKAKLAKGTKLVKDLLAAQSKTANSTEETNLRMIEVASFADAIDDWRLRLPDTVGDSSDFGLPISDEELDNWVNYQYYHAPDDVRVQGSGTYEEHRGREEAWMRTLDDKLIALLKSRDSSFDEKKFKEILEITNEMFHPFNIDHYNLSNYAKGLFRATLWQGKDRLKTVEASIEKVSDLLTHKQDNDALILRLMYEQYPDTSLSTLGASQLELTDPLFAARLCDEARSIIEKISFDRAVKDVLSELELPYINAEKAAFEKELNDSMSRDPTTLQREINKLNSEIEAFNLQIPTLEQVLDDILPIRLWGNDHSKVKAAIIAYSNNKGSLEEVTAAIRQTLQPKNEGAILSSDDILLMSVRYHNARHSNVRNWNFADFLAESERLREVDEVLENRRVAKEKLELINCDPLVVNLVRQLVENGEGTRLPAVLEDFQDIMKRFRGEIDGLVTSAKELDNKTFDKIRKAIETANPGKKITLDKAVDPGLLSGFVVKAGVQRFDFSLATAVNEGRKAVQSAR